MRAVCCTCEQINKLQYSFLEACKNGCLFSPKYQSCVREYSRMHVVVMMNNKPDYRMLSQDRIVEMDLDLPKWSVETEKESPVAIERKRKRSESSPNGV